MTEEKELIVISGVRGSGRLSFAACYKNSFLKSLPLVNGKDEITEFLVKGESFSTINTLTNESHQALLDIAKKLKYKITIYYLFSGKLLSLQRHRFKALISNEAFDLKKIEEEYDLSYNGLIEAFNKADLVFFVNNQKEFKFVSAYDQKDVTKDEFRKAVNGLKKSVDTLK